MGVTLVCALPGVWRSPLLTSRVTGAGQTQLLCSSLRTRDSREPRRLNAGGGHPRVAVGLGKRAVSAPTSPVFCHAAAAMAVLWKAAVVKERPACRPGRRASGPGCPWSPRAGSRPPEACGLPVSAQQWAWGGGDGLAARAGPGPPRPHLHSPFCLYFFSAATRFFALFSPHRGISSGLEVRGWSQEADAESLLSAALAAGEMLVSAPGLGGPSTGRRGRGLGTRRRGVALAVSAGPYRCRLPSACSKGSAFPVSPVGWFGISQHRGVESSIRTLSVCLLVSGAGVRHGLRNSSRLGSV